MNLSSGLPYSAEVYAALLGEYNAAWWPLTLFGSVLALGFIGAFVQRPLPSPLILKSLALFVAVQAGLVAVLHQHRMMGTLDFLASYYAAGWGFFSVWILLRWGWASPDAMSLPPRHRARLGIGVMLAAVILYPLLQISLRGTPVHAEYLGSAPDPLALFVLGVALACAPPKRWDVLAIPVSWIAISTVHAVLLERPADLLPIAVLTLVICVEVFAYSVPSGRLRK